MKRRGELIKVGDLFTKYRSSIKAPQGSVIEAAVEVIYDVTGIKLDRSRCQYAVASRTLATNAPALVRQELARYHDEILVHMKGRLGEKSTPTRII